MVGSKIISVFYLPTGVFTDLGKLFFFKGIIIDPRDEGRINTLVKNKQTTVILFDANGQKQGRVDLSTNDFGSYNGSFVLPEGQMNGQFSLQDSLTNGQVSFFCRRI